jgi:hypothetical protein
MFGRDYYYYYKPEIYRYQHFTCLFMKLSLYNDTVNRLSMHAGPWKQITLRCSQQAGFRQKINSYESVSTGLRILFKLKYD